MLQLGLSFSGSFDQLLAFRACFVQPMAKEGATGTSLEAIREAEEGTWEVQSPLSTSDRESGTLLLSLFLHFFVVAG